MYSKSVSALKIGNLEINPPIIQGGMGVRVSRANLASAVANTGCLGVIASSGLGQFEDSPGSEFDKLNEQAMRSEIRKARSQSKGPIGVNIMVAVADYENLVKAAVEEDVDVIISGAGLPLTLPKYLNGKDIKLIPIVSSVRTFKMICKRWVRHFNKVPDAVIVEGFRAGGHLGYSHEDIANGSAPSLEQIVAETIEFANTFEPRIPVIAAGGIFDGEDIARFINLGASGVQMATRFVCTDECDAHDNFKQAYLDAKEEDITIIHSPVGLPGRVIKNQFVKDINEGVVVPFSCKYHCLRTCNPRIAPYCIAKVLANSAQGKMDQSFAFAGSNAYRCNEIISVKSLVEKLVEQLILALSEEKPCSGAISL